jgi:FkbM family methyltransferase
MTENKKHRGTPKTRSTAFAFWTAVGMAPLLVAGIAMGYSRVTASAIAHKLSGYAQGCSWQRIMTAGVDQQRFQVLQNRRSKAQIHDSDDRFDIELVGIDGQQFWLKRTGEGMNGRELLAYLLTEHEWMRESNSAEAVKSGDIVIDCGGHVGVFTHHALKLGARKVIAIEPDPVNIECFRRNHRQAIEDGRVVLVEKGAWSTPGTIRLYKSTSNSGMNSMVLHGQEKFIEVPVTTIDSIAAELRLPRVDYIKMDIEGAEREALAGARGVLQKFKPRLMLDSYHRDDDPVVLPAVIKAANPSYDVVCGPCEWDNDRSMVPHVTYYK